MHDFKKVEEEVKQNWFKNKIVSKAREASSKGKKKFYFMDGPPYATGNIHMGTALNKILKDVILRSKRMQGFDVFDRPGYDTHGVPIENKVEKKIGVETKQDIENFGVKKFIDECRNFATEYIDSMNEEFRDIGVWMDWDNSYKTLDNEYIESVWLAFKKASEKGLLYLGKYPVHACPHCETAVAFNEIEYTKQTDESIYVKFKLKGEDRYLVIWTTTPWTLPSNTGVMVHSNFDYAEVKIAGENLIVAKERIVSLMKLLKKNEKDYKIVKEFKGKDLIGKKYENPIAKNLKLPELKNAYRIISGDRYVNLEDGTGLVHTAPGCGKEDFDAGTKAGLPVISIVNIGGIFEKEGGKYFGKKAKEVNKEIINDLKESGDLFYRQSYTHDYPICWRCKSPLLMISTPQWFFKISEIQKKLLSENEKVNWIPSWAKERMKAWLEGIGDWPISRQRYWGTPLPIWICDECEKTKVIGSINELEKLSGKKVKDLHKPEIDEFKIKCSCGSSMSRVPEVLDVWFDSGVTSWAALNYPQKKDLFKKYWPADLNLEGTDQFRGWWNSQLILSTIVFDKKPFENIFVHGMVLDLGKKKMSKSLGNVVSPENVVEKYGRDSLRYYLCLANPGMNLSYDEKTFKDINKFFTILLNIKNLIENEYSLEFLDKVKVKKIEDKWIVSRLENLKKDFLLNYNKFIPHKNIELMEEFLIKEFSRNYIQMIRERINDKDGDVKNVLNYVLSSALTLMAPIIPYLTDSLYSQMNPKRESIHLESLPKPNEKNIDELIEERFETTFKIIERGLAERDKNKIGLRWPLKIATVTFYKALPDEFQEIIKESLNVKEIEYITFSDGEISVEFDTKMTPELEAEGYAREVTRQVQSYRKKLGLNKEDLIELSLIVDAGFKEILEKNSEFLKERTNSKKLDIVTTSKELMKETFKNKTDFKIKDKKGEMIVVVK